MRFNPPLIPLRFRQENEIYYVAMLGNKFYKRKGKNEFLCIFIALPSCHPHHVHWCRRAIVIVAPLCAVVVVMPSRCCCRSSCCCVPSPLSVVRGHHALVRDTRAQGPSGWWWCLPIVVVVGVAQCHGCWWVAHGSVW